MINELYIMVLWTDKDIKKTKICSNLCSYRKSMIYFKAT